jgi:hypothetical protein
MIFTVTNTKGICEDFIATSPTQALNAARYHGLIRVIPSAKVAVSALDTIMRERYPQLLEEAGSQAGAMGARISFHPNVSNQLPFVNLQRRKYFYKNIFNPSNIVAKIET